MKKSEVLSALRTALNDKITSFESELNDLQFALSQDSKSTAGDKHETSRAMAQLEQEKLGKQLGDLVQMYQRLEGINAESVHSSIHLGSLVKMTNGFFFIGIPFGQLILAGEAVFCLSPIAPLGQLLLEKQIGDIIELNGNKLEVLEVC